MHDLSVPIEGTHHRRESAAVCRSHQSFIFVLTLFFILRQKSKEMRPLLTREPLPHDRERKPAAPPPRRRKRVQPTTPALSFHPLHNHVPSGKQDPPASQPFTSGPASESLPAPHDEQPTTPVVDRETYDQFYDGRDVQKRPRIFSEYTSVEHSTSPYPDSPCTDTNDMSSVPPPSDQPPCAAEYAVYTRPPQTPMSVCPYVSQAYGPPPGFHQDPYSYPVEPSPERTVQNFPVQHFDAAHGRAGLHGVGVPAYPDNNIYSYPHRRY